jgi:hypothetical protein
MRFRPAPRVRWVCRQVGTVGGLRIDTHSRPAGPRHDSDIPAGGRLYMIAATATTYPSARWPRRSTTQPGGARRWTA